MTKATDTDVESIDRSQTCSDRDIDVLGEEGCFFNVGPRIEEGNCQRAFQVSSFGTRKLGAAALQMLLVLDCPDQVYQPLVGRILLAIDT
jgi:hypothetical protein